MLQAAISLRFIMLVASLGAAMGALLMLLEGCERMLEAAWAMLQRADTKVVVASVMGGTDAFLFGMLVIFAYVVAFGFVFVPTAEQRAAIPAWMRVGGIHELKNTLFGVILVYLLVDFATDLPESGTVLAWEMLVKPLSILAIAAAFRLFAANRAEDTHRE